MTIQRVGSGCFEDFFHLIGLSIFAIASQTPCPTCSALPIRSPTSLVTFKNLHQKNFDLVFLPWNKIQLRLLPLLHLFFFLVFVLFQRKNKLVTKLLSLIIFILTWIGGGIRWFVSLRKIKVGSNETTLRKIFLLLYIIPIFGIPCNFLSDLYTSAILTILRPKYLHTMRQPK